MDTPRSTPLWLRALLWALALAALAAVFMWYQQPDLMVEIANQIWSCF
ncbi:hypothetical protein IS481_11525 [Caldimonas thermodepolymerans]|jgi:hypothetical protein|uniref:Uncharacterized protein n=1 Tax=Caldimonas thermodepolymerans TaxID=215580 RepID=A0AA46DG11_9BURK|nr:hypothetical protein [Caldimonas thermodepolymerans]QPC30407.1 hypothetical protein IS481_11525 [Caldimonas thermodepolymerans]RDI03016.1 hypothetical protein DES46_102449 [Caldimonas thermodepolymerans]TCP08508.1 hypothetical protein EV676_10210 [Caldimonas thermodepolymerans]UZG43173.1 hypothetical protein ONZ46_12225 [Caldimonas thermodepolymerans]UZG46839.1 hypothetical protein ONS87_12875 [Caldimonas thermodepolymerans]